MPRIKENYPEIKVERQNLNYAKLLLQDYAGAVSELTALTQYFNHQSVIFKNYEEVSQVLSYIGLVETKHLQILGKLINLLGINPKYRIIKDDNKRVWWSPIYVDYEKDIYKIIEANIEGEKAAIKQYKEHLELIKDDYIIAILTRIIMDEQDHIKILTEVYNNLKENKPIKFMESLTNYEEREEGDLVPPNREFTPEELKEYYNGENGRPAYVVIDQIVFDVSNIGSWGGGTHFGIYAGENHTEVFNRHHLGNIQLLKDRVPMVGYLKQ
ncbi:hypothetical protein SDC9_115895 [bioreactor metagenome]|uniref:Cytochrome b5 heme-binding domain-containing protein n=1 Tax=bioreactor metagenome TaxID=1076179 RepID=A0A645BV49_9ZZZZ